MFPFAAVRVWRAEVAIMVDRVSNISGEHNEVQEKLMGKAHDMLIRSLDLG